MKNKESTKKHDINGKTEPTPRKVFAQHWLRNEGILSKIVEAARLVPSDRILEIGPGTGVLTRKILPWVQYLVAVEVDSNLCKKIVKEIGDKENFLLLQGDFLELDLQSLLTGIPLVNRKLNKVVANIPYNITGPIIEKLLGKISKPNEDRYEAIVLLVQKEVAQRLTAKPGTKAFGALTVRVQYLAECEMICNVPSQAFYPPPKVESAVIHLTPRIFKTEANDPKKLEMIVKLGFSSKRKMLRNNLQSIIDKDQFIELMEKLEINPQVRGEDLGVEEWVRLANQLV
ncbi:MAG: 16S rRNA (adenine(1518)-N(6)/adenine(1519)-N(6))-dimethyltransferase RsmA [Cyanobacteria bacterium P01_A01_bin.84]